MKIAGIELRLAYNSAPILFPQLDKFSGHAFPYWRLNLARRIYRNTNGSAINAVRGDGSILTFTKQGASFIADADVGGRLVADGANLLLFSDNEGLIEKYNADGRLLAITTNAGRQIAFTYSDASTPPEIASTAGALIGITDDLDGSIQLRYEAGSGGLKTLTALRNTQDVVTLTYDGAGRLSSVVFPDSSSKILEYTDANHSTALTGVLHEDGVSRSVYAYDSYGRATSTGIEGMPAVSLAFNGTPVVSTTQSFNSATGVLTKTHEWSVPSSVGVTQPSGAVSQQAFDSVLGFPRLTSSSQPAGSGCSAATKTQAFDANGNVTQRNDFNGFRSCYAFDSSRNLEVSRVEGLAGTAACSSVVSAGATLPAGSRKISTQYHPAWRLPTKTAEPSRLTTKVYNGQPDPFNGGAIVSCAPASASLPDGSAIVVLCKQVEQATTDTNGAQGLAATLDATVPNRVQQWTYNQYGQVLTANDPLNNTTAYAYYSDTTADHTKGGLNTVTNAKQQVTTFTKYNAAGQWLEMKDANDVLTTRTFDLRQRLKSLKTGTALTSYDYWPTGLLQKVTLPDSSSLSYGYDDAHRLTGITDNLGNSITYTLDNSGNRTGEDVKDPSGTLAKTLTRVPDALNRIQQVTGRH
ncbi:hypothetical protein [Roseateles sp. P5_E1]